jgi:hypothetical protein
VPFFQNSHFSGLGSELEESHSPAIEELRDNWSGERFGKQSAHQARSCLVWTTPIWSPADFACTGITK